MATIHPYLGFNGNCREAMKFYKYCLGGKLDILTYGNSQMGDQTPEELKEQIMHSALMSEHGLLMASDMGEEYKGGTQVAVCLVCKSKEEIQDLYSKLSEGGKIGHELVDEFFGTFGDFVDKFGISWMLQYSTPEIDAEIEKSYEQ